MLRYETKNLKEQKSPHSYQSDLPKIKPTTAKDADQITIFDEQSNLNSSHNDILVRLEEEFSLLGLSANQFKVFVYLGKYGAKTAIDIWRALRMPRTETYSLLKRLMNLGIVSATLDRPTRFKAVPPEIAISTILSAEKERLDSIERQKSSVINLWNAIPDFMKGTTDDIEEKFQILKGSNQIHSKLKYMAETADKEFEMAGTEKDYLQFYHAEIFSFLEQNKAEKKFVTTCSKQSLYIFDTINGSKIRQILPGTSPIPSFVIKDNDELLLFLNETGRTNRKEQKAVHTDSKEIINSLKLLFGFVWSQSGHI